MAVVGAGPLAGSACGLAMRRRAFAVVMNSGLGFENVLGVLPFGHCPISGKRPCRELVTETGRSGFLAAPVPECLAPVRSGPRCTTAPRVGVAEACVSGNHRPPVGCLWMGFRASCPSAFPGLASCLHAAGRQRPGRVEACRFRGSVMMRLTPPWPRRPLATPLSGKTLSAQPEFDMIGSGYERSSPLAIVALQASPGR